MKKLIIASFLLLQACAPGELKTTASQKSNATFSDCGTSVCEVATDMKTVQVSNSENLLTSMLQHSGVTTPSKATTSAYVSQNSKIAETGSVSSITAPMWMAISTVASEVCNDLVTQEKAATSRRFFAAVDFTKGPSSFVDSQRNDVIRRLARAFWDRNETPIELMVIKAGLDESFSGTTAADTTKEMLFACTAMMSAVDAQKL